jgi:hypothetical protein
MLPADPATAVAQQCHDDISTGLDEHRMNMTGAFKSKENDSSDEPRCQEQRCNGKRDIQLVSK